MTDEINTGKRRDKCGKSWDESGFAGSRSVINLRRIKIKAVRQKGVELLDYQGQLAIA